MIPSQMPSCSALRRLVIRFVLPQRMKSASFNCPMNACLHASALGTSNNLSAGGSARWRTNLSGTGSAVGLGLVVAAIVWLSYNRPIGQCLQIFDSKSTIRRTRRYRAYTPLEGTAVFSLEPPILLLQDLGTFLVQHHVDQEFFDIWDE